VLARISNAEGSILTINQNIPIHNWASVVISLDISNMVETLDELTGDLRDLRGVSDVKLVSVE
jgi:chorismate mutase